MLFFNLSDLKAWISGSDKVSISLQVLTLNTATRLIYINFLMYEFIKKH